MMMLRDEDEKMEQLVQIGRWQEAAQVAVQARNVDAIQTIIASCGDPEVQSYCRNALRS